MKRKIYNNKEIWEYVPNVPLIQASIISFINFLSRHKYAPAQTIQTAYLLSQGGLCRPKLTRHDMLRFYDRLLSATSRPLVEHNTHSGVKFNNFLKKYSNFKHET